jgi:hypothetical protein
MPVNLSCVTRRASMDSSGRVTRAFASAAIGEVPHPAAQAARFARSRHSLTPKSRLADAGAYGDGFNAGTPMPSSICGNCHSGICVNGVHRTNCDPGFGVASEKRRFTKQRRFLPQHFGGKHNGDFTGRLGVRSVSSRADCRRRCDSRTSRRSDALEATRLDPRVRVIWESGG